MPNEINYQIIAFSKELATILFLCSFSFAHLIHYARSNGTFHMIFRELYSPEIVSPNYILFCTSQLNSVRSLIHHRSNTPDWYTLAKVVFLLRMSHFEKEEIMVKMLTQRSSSLLPILFNNALPS